MHDTVYHIYARDKVLYHNVKESEFEEKWEMLTAMVGLLKTDYTESDLSYIRLAPNEGHGGGKILWEDPAGEDSY